MMMKIVMLRITLMMMKIVMFEDHANKDCDVEDHAMQ